MKKQDEIDEQLAAARREAEIRKNQEEMDMRILAEEIENAELEKENAGAKQSSKNNMELARNGTDTITESDKAIAIEQGSAEKLSEIQNTLHPNKASYRN